MASLSIIFWTETKEIWACDEKGMEKNLRECKVLMWSHDTYMSGALGFHTAPSHCSSVPSHLPGGSSSGWDSRGSGDSNSSTGDSIDTSTLQSAGAGGGLPEQWRSRSASLQRGRQTRIELNLQGHALACNILKVWSTQLLTYRLRLNNIHAKLKI